MFFKRRCYDDFEFRFNILGYDMVLEYFEILVSDVFLYGKEVGEI